MYEPNLESINKKTETTKFGTGDKYDMYRFVKEATKSPGPVYNYPVPADFSYSDSTKKGVSKQDNNW
jgi:hypothetical protein